MQASLSALRRPAHTGENRCWPCTVANLAVLAAVSIGLGIVAPPAAGVVAVLGAAVIWLRGYLVPYTPRFAPQIAARLPGDPFHVEGNGPGTGRNGGSDPPPSADGVSSIADADANAADESGDQSPGDGEAVLSTLIEAGVVDADGGDVTLDGDVEARWQAEMASLREVPPEDLAAATLAVAPAAADVDVVRQGGRTYVVLSDGSDDVAAESWLRRPAAIAETAAARALADAGVPVDQRADGADALTLFLETCPGCNGDVVERLSGGCCGPPQRGPDGNALRALVCEECTVQFATFE